MSDRKPLYSEDPVAKGIADKYWAEQTGVNLSGNWAGSVGVAEHNRKRDEARRVRSRAGGNGGSGGVSRTGSSSLGAFSWSRLSSFVTLCVTLASASYLSDSFALSGWTLWLISGALGVAAGALTTLAVALVLGLAMIFIAMNVLMSGAGWAWGALFG
jgi:hypothetical protein